MGQSGDWWLWGLRSGPGSRQSCSHQHQIPIPATRTIEPKEQIFPNPNALSNPMICASLVLRTVFLSSFCFKVMGVKLPRAIRPCLGPLLAWGSHRAGDGFNGSVSSV